MHRESRESRESRTLQPTRTISGTPLVLDCTCFVELLSRVEDPDTIDSSKADLALNATQESLRRFAAKQRLGWNPRREKTWERCVLAETMRQSLCQQCVHNIDEATFASQYLQDLRDRGYAGVEEILQQPSPGEIGGPNRLDRRQRRLLGRYNAFMKKERESTIKNI
jgi:hypothetical protein